MACMKIVQFYFCSTYISVRVSGNLRNHTTNKTAYPTQNNDEVLFDDVIVDPGNTYNATVLVVAEDGTQKAQTI